MAIERRCPDCETSESGSLSRRQFVASVGATAAATSAIVLPTLSAAEKKPAVKSETLVKKLYDSLSEAQKKQICFAWDYTEAERGLLRTRVDANWNITAKELTVGSNFYTKDQQELIEAIYFGLYNPDWKDRIRKQLQDDTQGFGNAQWIAIFGTPGSGKFEFVMSGRHLTIRCDGDSTEHVAFGGPIFYGHASGGFDEPADHAGNVYWHQAQKANALYKMLDGKQRKLALIEEAPNEHEVGFQSDQSKVEGIPISELSSDQKEHAQGVLKSLLEPYRGSDRGEAMKSLVAQGGLDKCHLSFYKENDIGEDGVWDIWRLEGPAFVWHFRGAPHVHVWVNVADDPSVKLNS